MSFSDRGKMDKRDACPTVRLVGQASRLSALCALLLLTGTLNAGEPERLTTDGKLKSAPVFASAHEIVFAVHEIPNQVVLKRLKLKDRAQELAHPSLKSHQFDPAFSPD